MKFSVIIPAHNSAGYIKNALESIAEQTFTDYELIVVCDSCTDNTADVAREYADIVEEVEYHADGPTRNRGIELATGDWVLFMDDDDWWLHEYVLQQLSDKIDAEPWADIIAFSFIFRHIGYAKPIRKCNGCMWIACWCKCYRRSVIGDARFSDITDGSADMQFFNGIFSKGLRICFWDMPMYYYNYWREDSISERITHDFRWRTDLL